MAKKQKYPANFDTEKVPGALLWRTLDNQGPHPRRAWWVYSRQLYFGVWGPDICAYSREEALSMISGVDIE